MRWLAALALCLVLAPPSWSQTPVSPPAPRVQVEGLKRISPHVHVIPDNSVPMVPNVGFVVGSKAVLVVDTGLGPANGAAVAAAAARLAPGRQVYLVATHAHPEHDLGATAFPSGSKLIRSQAQAEEGEADLRLADLFRARSPAARELLAGAAVRPADITFADTYRLDLGGVVVTLKALGPAHTDGDTAAWVEADRVLFSGDLAMRAQPAITTARASGATWRRALDHLTALGAAVVVPSHGPMGDAGLMAGYRAYLEEVAERTARAKAAGADLEVATEAVWREMRGRFPDRGRLAGAVRMAYAAP